MDKTARKMFSKRFVPSLLLSMFSGLFSEEDYSLCENVEAICEESMRDRIKCVTHIIPGNWIMYNNLMPRKSEKNI